jgi:hypothetical protein
VIEFIFVAIPIIIITIWLMEDDLDKNRDRYMVIMRYYYEKIRKALFG